MIFNSAPKHFFFLQGYLKGYNKLPIWIEFRVAQEMHGKYMYIIWKWEMWVIGPLGPIIFPNSDC